MGRIINRHLVEGQIEGAVHMGLGYALCEELVTKDGKTLNTTFLDYKLLAAEDMPWPQVHLFQVDERIAPDGDPDRNLTHIRAALLDRAPLLPAAQVHAVALAAEAARRGADVVADEQNLYFWNQREGTTDTALLYTDRSIRVALLDQGRCRGYQECVKACPYKKVFYNPMTGTSEKCIACYPKIETGIQPQCFVNCIGKIRLAGTLSPPAQARSIDAASAADADGKLTELLQDRGAATIIIDPSAKPEPPALPTAPPAPLEEEITAAIQEAFKLLQWYARNHTLACVVPALFIAGAVITFLSQASVMRYLGPRANQPVAYTVASVSGTVLAVCSCSVLPMFAGIWKMGAGLGPASESRRALHPGSPGHHRAPSLHARLDGVPLDPPGRRPGLPRAPPPPTGR